MRPGLLLSTLILTVFLCAAPFTASAAGLIYDQTLHGGLLQTGNAIGLSKALSVNGPGTAGSIGTFISTNPSLQDLIPANGANPWFGGTTNSWQQQNSAAILDLPGGATVTHALLVWGGSYDYLENVTAFLDDAVALSFEAETATSVVPQPSLSFTIAQTSPSGFAVNYYQRSAEVTNYGAARGAGQYAVGGIPATQHEMINTLNAGGWTLLVAYELASEPLRNVQIQIVGQYVDELSTSTVVFSGFEASDTIPVSASVFVAAMEGDANLAGDQLLLRDPSSTLVPLSSVERPADNFFPSIISDETGVLDTAGTFGTRNHAAGSPNSGARQGWDITGVSLSSNLGQLSPGQQSLELVATTTGDEFMLCAAGLVIEVVGKVTAAPDPIPGVAHLYGCHPNPFNPSTMIRYSLPRSGHVELEIYDLGGRQVRTLVREVVEAGEHRARWNGRDDAGAQVVSGVYLYRLRTDDHVETRRMVLLK